MMNSKNHYGYELGSEDFVIKGSEGNFDKVEVDALLSPPRVGSSMMSGSPFEASFSEALLFFDIVWVFYIRLETWGTSNLLPKFL
jgi:hypothetical protein